MTTDKDLKRLVRARMAKTGESYTTALRHIRARAHNSTPAEGAATKPVLICSFCRKTQHDVQKLIRGPDVFICDGCIEDTHALQNGEVPASSIGIVAASGTQRCSFCGNPDPKAGQRSWLARLLDNISPVNLLPSRRRRLARVSSTGADRAATMRQRGAPSTPAPDESLPALQLFEAGSARICEDCIRLCDAFIREAGR